MNCPHCSGLIIQDRGICGVPDRLKCALCGRDPNKVRGGNDMEEKKTCIKCGKELPKTEEYFRKNSSTKDGFEGQCKECRKKYFADYRAGKRVNQTSKKKTKISARRMAPERSNPSPFPVPIGHASPEAIVKALRTGVAVEMIQKIGLEYGVKVTLESV